jgi:hypothetical protein
VISIIQCFLDGTAGKWDWDDFISVPIKDDPFLEEIRKRCAALPEEFPPDKSGQYCNEEGVKILKEYTRILQEKSRKITDSSR